MTARETVMAAILAVDGSCPGDDAALATVGDSLARLEVVIDIEDRLGVDLGDDAHELATVGDLVRRVEERMPPGERLRAVLRSVMERTER